MRKGKTGRVERLLRGVAEIRITGAAPWKLINACIRERITVEGVESDDLITCRALIFAADAKRVKSLAPRCGCDVEVLSVRGRPVWKKFLHRRRWAALCAAAVAAAVLVSSLFVWDIRVTENDSDVPDALILHTLAEQGVGVGSFWPGFRGERIRSRALAELPGLSWLAVNVRGCVARVQVVERVRGQDMVEDGPANVVARRPGLVTRVEALGGQAAVVPGDTVTQGQLLISGAVDLDNGGLRWQHGMGRVWARTWYELTAQVPLTVRQRGVPLSSRTRYALDIGKKRIKLYGKGSTLGGDCDKITQYRPVCLPWGLRLPITVAAETVTAYGPSTDLRRSAGEARQEGEALLREQLEALLGDTGAAESVRIDAVEQGSWLLVTLRAECLEEIGREVPLTKE